MGEARIQNKELMALLAKYSETSEITFEVNGSGPRGQGTSYEFVEITERRLGGTTSLVILGIAVTKL